MIAQIKSSQAFAYAELLEILSHMEKEYVEKIPNKLMDIFKSYASAEYVNHLDGNIPFEEQQISEETSALLAMLLLNYWYESEEEKQELLKLYNDNEIKHQEELRKKYNPDNIFSSQSEKENIDSSNKSIQNIPSDPSTLPLDYNSLSWYKKLFTRFKTFIYNLFSKKQQNS